MRVSSEQEAVSSKRLGVQHVRTRVFVFICLLLAVLLPTVSLHAQQAQIFRIGFLDDSTASGSAVLVDVFWKEMRKLG